MSKFLYPRLSRKEIVSILADSKIAELSERDLLSPLPDLVVNLYHGLLIHLDCQSEEDHGQLDFAALEHLENPEFHIDSGRIISLFSKIKGVVSLLDCPMKFSLKDLIKPDGDRTEMFLSAILNFCLHKDTKMNYLRPVVEDLSNLDIQQKELESKISQVNAEIAYCNKAREQELPVIQEVESKKKELCQIIAGLNNQQMSVRASYWKMKEKVEAIDKKISSAEFALVQSVQENANLRSKIVQSPDKLQRALEEKRSACEEAKNAERSAMQSFQEKSAIDELYSKVLKKIGKSSVQMKAIQKQVDSSKSIEKDFKSLKMKLSDEEVLVKSLEAKLVEQKGKVQHLVELRKQLEKEKDLTSEEVTKEFHNVKTVVESRRHALEVRKRNIEAKLADVDACNSEINSVKESGAVKAQELLSKHEEIIKEFNQYVESVGALLLTAQLQPGVN